MVSRVGQQLVETLDFCIEKVEGLLTLRFGSEDQGPRIEYDAAGKAQFGYILYEDKFVFCHGVSF